jgi:hypothetical protein
VFQNQFSRLPRYVFHVQDGTSVAFDEADYADDSAAKEAAGEYAKKFAEARCHPSRIIAINEVGEKVAEFPIRPDGD